MNTVKIYLAGGMKCGWQDRVTQLAPDGVQFLDPRTWATSDPAIYTAKDLSAVRECDCILAYMDSSNPSGFGLCLEIGYAYALGKRIIFVDAVAGDWRTRYFDMCRQVSSVCTSFAEALELCLAS